MSQVIHVGRRIDFYKGGGGSKMASFDCDDSTTVLYLRPQTDDTESLNIGDGTKDMDVKIFLGTTSDYGLFDVGNKQLSIYRDGSSTGNAIYMSYTSSATSGNVYGIRMFVSGTGASSGALRGIRCEADAGASAEASLLEAGLFTAKVSSGGQTITNIRALTGHISIGTTLTVSGDMCCVNAHMQSRSAESIGTHCCVLMTNEAVGGTGVQMGGYMICKATNLSGGIKAAAYLIDGGTDTSLLKTAMFRIPDDATVADADGMSASSALDNFNDFDGYITITIGTQVTHLLTLNTIPS